LKRIPSLLAAVVGAALLGLGTGCRPKQEPDSAPPAAVESVNRGVSLIGQYDYDGAAKAFAEALAAAPELSVIKINLAIARFNRGSKENQDIEQAQALLDAVLQKEPGNIRAWYFKGIVLLHIGRSEPAIACFEKVVQARPGDGVAWYLLGMCRQRTGQQAERELLKAVELRPYLTSAYYKLWQTYQAGNQLDKAQPFLDKFMRLRDSPLNEIIEVPQYNQMGDLALAQPIGGQPPPPIARSIYHAGTPIQISLLSLTSPPPANAGPPASPIFGGAAFAGSDHDGRPEFFLVACPGIRSSAPICLNPAADGPPFPAPATWGLEKAEQPLSCAVGDYDNDEVPDLFIICNGTNHLFHGSPNGSFTEVTRDVGITANGGTTRSALWLDADHDGDLDLFVCNSGAPNQLFNNNADGTFTDIASSAGVAVPEGNSVMVLPGDLDGDRTMDLVILRSGAPAKIFLNDLGGKYHEANLDGLDIRGDLGGVLQDFDGDGILDLLVLGGQPAELKLFLGDGHGHFRPSDAFAVSAKAAAALGPLRGFRVADLDLDGHLDIAFFSSEEGHILLNDGKGRFTLQAHVWKAAPGNEIAGAELADLNGDFVPELLLVERGKTSRVSLVPGELSPPSTAISLAPTGVRSRDKRTRSPASGYGVMTTVRAGLREQSRFSSGQAGGFNQSPLPMVFGLGGARQADYVHLLWSDGVAQIETAMPAGQHHQVAEMQRKISSCPVLFAWNGARFEFITDFAGVGGLGYYVAPGEYASTQPLDYVKIEPQQLRPRDGAYELRITEPMEETAYVDQLELLAIDHPSGCQVFPDERLAVTGPPPTHELLVVDKPIFAQRALDPEGQDCTRRLLRVDRQFAYEPVLDRRFFGFCLPHTLDLDFGGQLAGLEPNQRVFLFINGYLEYPYSQTAYAASQARVGWEPIRIERLMPDGRWNTIVPDAGAMGGMDRTMTVDVTGLVGGPDCRLRLSSNLEIYYDQIFLAVPAARDPVKIHPLPMAEAELRYAGFAREVSPDGHQPLIYDYDQSDATAPFHTLSGAYTRYGPVRELLEAFDDQYVLVGPGDEIAVKFDARGLPALPDGMTRSFVLVSHAYCKDMDLYTATPQTLEPLPFRGMSRYPYPPDEHYPDTELHRRLSQTYNTRIVP
jgi:Flp pilus assembly protein TadD